MIFGYVAQSDKVEKRISITPEIVKKFNKEINLIVNENFLYAADNLGYLYAINLNDNSIVWAKNYGIPFRSNLKFANNQIFLS